MLEFLSLPIFCSYLVSMRFTPIADVVSVSALGTSQIIGNYLEMPLAAKMPETRIVEL